MIRRIQTAKHALALLLLAVLLSVFSTQAGKAGSQSRHKMFDDPVVNTMIWESFSEGILAEDWIALCIGNWPGICVTNCPDWNCVANCNVPILCG